MTKNKPVGLSFLNQKVKEISSVEKYYLDVEKNQFINYYPSFSVDKIDDLFVDLIESVQYCKSEKIDFLKTDSDILKYTYFLIIKHFTSLKGELQGKSVEIHISTLEKLYKTGLFELFLSDMFDEVEMQKVIDKLNNIEKLIVDLEKNKKDKINFVNENVQNEVLKNKLLKDLE